MSGRISTPLGAVAVAGTILLSGIFVGVRANTARADNCLTEPKSSAPTGSHWYYRSDRANQRKCWYLRALGQPAQHAAPGAISETTTTAHDASENLATGALISTSRSENASSSLHIEMCAPSDHCSVTIVTANKFQQVLAPNKANAPEGRGLTIENNNTNGDSCWVYIGSGLASKEESQQLTARESYVRYWPFVPSDGIQATCAASSDTLDVQYQ
jgi:hypothetical protein